MQKIIWDRFRIEKFILTDFSNFTLLRRENRKYRSASFEIRFNMYNLSPDIYAIVPYEDRFCSYSTILFRYTELLNFTFTFDFIPFDFPRFRATCDKNTKLKTRKYAVVCISDNFEKIESIASLLLEFGD